MKSNNMMFTVDEMVEQNLPQLANKPWLAKPTKAMLRYLLHEQQCNEIALQHQHLTGVDFVEQVLGSFNFSYSVPNSEIENIPIDGRVIIYANHPIGSLDALALIKLISKVRPDIKVVANELLMTIKPLHSILLPVRNMTGGTPKQHLDNIHQHLKSEGALLIFPSGEVSRLRPSGVTDLLWQTGFVKMAKACHAPLLPMFVDAKNSATFYGASMLYKPLATLLLVKEMFRQVNQVMPVRIGKLIAKETVANNDFPLKTQVKLLKNHLYRIGKNRPPLFSTQNAVAHPESRTNLQQELQLCEPLGHTSDNKVIYLYQHKQSSAIMREIGRLREIAFRAVGEGTGKHRDIDKYDNDYWHLVLWDKDDLEIVGAYRFASAKHIQQVAENGLYSQSLFTYHTNFAPYFEQGLELGRSFVQPKYWGRRSLEYLWQGIGAFLVKHPQYRYLFGPVTISNSYPEPAKELLIHFYKNQFPSQANLAKSFNAYLITDERSHQLCRLFNGDNYADNFKILKRTLANMAYQYRHFLSNTVSCVKNRAYSLLILALTLNLVIVLMD